MPASCPIMLACWVSMSTSHHVIVVAVLTLKLKVIRQGLHIGARQVVA